MASTITLVNNLRKYLGDGTIDWDGDTIKAAMLTSAYVANAAHSDFDDVSAAEVVAGNGYASGGIALTNKAVTLAGSVAKYTADPATWTGLTKTYRFLAVYSEKVVNGITNPLIAIILVDNTPADITISAADYSVQWNANGLFTLS